MVTAAKGKRVIRKRCERKNVEKGQAYVRSSFDNTMATAADMGGSVLSWTSSGGLGLRGSHKSTPFVARTVVETTTKAVMEYGLKTVEMYVEGPDANREAVIHAPQAAGLEATLVKDATPIPHNGYRPLRRRRV